MSRPGRKKNGCADTGPNGYTGSAPLGGQERAGNNARGAEHPSTTRKPHGPKAS
ncbi:hypothetical protein SLA_2939 [Streptomyces laurentii]|uniref:Uncharacterized protein n=1 Tax=Streptomyces laurentii TaxID=39478 RepID=A0A160P018_STRLU|nr:hypothetical protein SLA_2939 [Streptomyces laurentii]